MLLANDQRDAVAWHLIYWKTRIAPTGQEKRQGRETLLQILETLEIPASKDPHWEAAGLAKDIIRLNPTPEDQRRTRHALLKLPSRNTRLEALADIVNKLDPTPGEKHQIFKELLGFLNRERDSLIISQLADSMLKFVTSQEDALAARHAILRQLHRKRNSEGDTPFALIEILSELDPTVHDVRSWHVWVQPPENKLLAAARQNSPLGDWLAALPSLPSITKSVH